MRDLRTSEFELFRQEPDGLLPANCAHRFVTAAAGLTLAFDEDFPNCWSAAVCSSCLSAQMTVTGKVQKFAMRERTLELLKG